MPGRLTLSQRLMRPDGLPTATARACVVALMALAATAGYASVPERPATAAAPPAIAASGLAGDLPIAAPEAAPELRRAHAVPALRDGAAGRRAAPRRPVQTAATPVPTPAATATPEPAATATPAPAVVPVAEPPAPAPAPPPRSTPAPTFDSSG